MRGIYMYTKHYYKIGTLLYGYELFCLYCLLIQQNNYSVYYTFHSNYTSYKSVTGLYNISICIDW